MAAERFILASRVGEAALLLPEPMLVDFHGAVDADYPARLAQRLREVYGRPDLRALASTLPGLARRIASYDVLSEEFLRLVASLVPGLRIPPASEPAPPSASLTISPPATTTSPRA